MELPKCQKPAAEDENRAKSAFLANIATTWHSAQRDHGYSEMLEDKNNELGS